MSFEATQRLRAIIGRLFSPLPLSFSQRLHREALEEKMHRSKANLTECKCESAVKSMKSLPLRRAVYFCSRALATYSARNKASDTHASSLRKQGWEVGKQDGTC